MAKVASKSFQVGAESFRSARADAESATFTFGDPAAPIASRTVRLSDFSESIRACFAWHGLSAKLGDAYADAKGVASAALESFDDMLATLTAGNWLAEGEKAGPRESDLAAAIAALRPDKYATVADAAAMLAALEVDARKARANIPEVKAKLLEIRAERAVAAAKAAAAKAPVEGAPTMDDL